MRGRVLLVGGVVALFLALSPSFAFASTLVPTWTPTPLVTPMPPEMLGFIYQCEHGIIEDCQVLPAGWTDGGTFGNYVTLCMTESIAVTGVVWPPEACIRMPIWYEYEGSTQADALISVASYTLHTYGGPGTIARRYKVYPPAYTIEWGWDCVADSQYDSVYTKSQFYAAYPQAEGNWVKQSAYGDATDISPGQAQSGARYSWGITSGGGDYPGMFNAISTAGYSGALIQSTNPNSPIGIDTGCTYWFDLVDVMIPTQTPVGTPTLTGGASGTATAQAMATQFANMTATAEASTPTPMGTPSPSATPNVMATLLANWPTPLGTPNFATMEAIQRAIATQVAINGTPSPGQATANAAIATMLAKMLTPGTSTPTRTSTPTLTATPTFQPGSLSMGSMSPQSMPEATCWVVSPGWSIGFSAEKRWFQMLTFGLIDEALFIGINLPRYEICSRNNSLWTLEFFNVNITTWATSLLMAGAAITVLRFIMQR